ncbi:MAG: HAMP domain-containing histidine kinase [Calditrichaeota bacterium]|nr:HAMP domain-containing histidine kinase [Calditrichota bacterium]
MSSLKSYFAFTLIALASIAFCASLWVYYNYNSLGEALLTEQAENRSLITTYSRRLLSDLKKDTLSVDSQTINMANLELITEPYYSDGEQLYIARGSLFYRYNGVNKQSLLEMYRLKRRLETSFLEETFTIVKWTFLFITIAFLLVAFLVYRSFTRDMNKNIDKIIQEIENPGYVSSTSIQEFDQILNSVHRYQAISSQVERQNMVMDLMSKWRVEIRKIVHDLKNPLQRIFLTLSDQDKTDSIHLAMQAVEEIKLSLKNLRSMEFTDEINIVEIELGPFFNNTRSLFYDIDITLTNELEKPFQFDEFAFNRLCSNVIQNAIEAGASGISFHFYNQDGKTVIDITNDGEMIKHPDKLFVPFSTTKAEGSGLGLIIILQIIDAHGGRYFLKKSDENETVFTAELK